MGNEIQISAAELYFLGELMHAKYFDYAYVREMQDIGQHGDLFRSQAKISLSDKNIIMEDFSGEIEVSPESQKVLKPIFFGERISAVDISDLQDGEESKYESTRFHFFEGSITQVVIKGGVLSIKATDEIGIQQYVDSISPKIDGDPDEAVDENYLTKENISRILAAKYTHIGGNSYVEYFIEHEGKLYQELDEGERHVMALSKDQFEDTVYFILREG